MNRSVSGRYPLVTRLLLPGLMAALLALAGCISAPTQQMTDARLAISAAREAAGSLSGGNSGVDLERAEGLLQAAVGDLERGDYKAARENAEAAREAAVLARSRAETTPRP